MGEKVYFIVLIFCATLSQGIFEKFLEKDVGESSKLLARQKRVIDRRLGGETPVLSGHGAYVVNIKKYGRQFCTGSILSRHTAITAARCVEVELEKYLVVSGSTYTFRGNEHNITEKKMHGHNPSRHIVFLTGIALITVYPLFTINPTTTSIDLYTGPVSENMVGTVYGWGTHVYSGSVETVYPKRLRSITVPIMDHRNCQDVYREHFRVTDEDICTYHSQKLCGSSDAGAPLVINNQLVGVHIGEVLLRVTDCPISPDIFVLLQHRNYGPWIARNIVH